MPENLNSKNEGRTLAMKAKGEPDLKLEHIDHRQMNSAGG
jgi:hypothetical protein